MDPAIVSFGRTASQSRPSHAPVMAEITLQEAPSTPVKISDLMSAAPSHSRDVQKAVADSKVKENVILSKRATATLTAPLFRT